MYISRIVIPYSRYEFVGTADILTFFIEEITKKGDGGLSLSLWLICNMSDVRYVRRSLPEKLYILYYILYSFFLSYLLSKIEAKIQLKEFDKKFIDRHCRSSVIDWQIQMILPAFRCRVLVL